MEKHKLAQRWEKVERFYCLYIPARLTPQRNIRSLGVLWSSASEKNNLIDHSIVSHPTKKCELYNLYIQIIKCDDIENFTIKKNCWRKELHKLAEMIDSRWNGKTYNRSRSTSLLLRLRCYSLVAISEVQLELLCDKDWAILDSSVHYIILYNCQKTWSMGEDSEWWERRGSKEGAQRGSNKARWLKGMLIVAMSLISQSVSYVFSV